MENLQSFLQNWSCGLHRVIIYGDHTRDLNRFCRFMKIRQLREGIDDLQNVEGLEWETRARLADDSSGSVELRQHAGRRMAAVIGLK